MEEMSSILRLIGSSNRMFEGNVFNEMAVGFKEVAVLSEKSAAQQHNAINERFHLLIDVLTAHRYVYILLRHCILRHTMAGLTQIKNVFQFPVIYVIEWTKE